MRRSEGRREAAAARPRPATAAQRRGVENGAMRSTKPLSRSAVAGAVLGAAGLAGLVGLGLGFRLGLWSFPPALVAAEWLVYAAALGVLLAAIGAVRSRPGAGKRGFVLSLLGLALALPVVAIGAQWEYATRTTPQINDVSTDTEDAPVFWHMPNPTQYPAQSAALQRAGYPDLATLKLGIGPERAYAHALAVVKDNGWEIVADDPKDGRIEAIATSLLYGFKDEIAIRVAAADGGSRVDVRSRSRLGRIDRGVNAKRIRAYLAALRSKEGEAGR